MARRRKTWSVWLAAFAARWWVAPLPPGAPKPTPRRERLFGRPFAFLVKWDGVLVPVRPEVAEEGGDAGAERRWLDAAAAGLKN